MIILKESELPWNQHSVDTKQPNKFEFLMIHVLPENLLNSLYIAELCIPFRSILLLFDEGDDVFEWFYRQLF